MRLLVIGGTRFSGRHLVEAALARGWDVTVFHRGSNPSPFTGVREILGDRGHDLDRLTGTWDVVVDMCGYVPRLVAASCDALRARTGRYVFVSSISVYDAATTGVIDENSPAAMLAEPTETVDGDTFGPLKALCEAAARERYHDALIVRPGLIVGPYDFTDRFGYWVRRLARGGEVLAPGDGSALAGFVDARDLVRWMLDAIEAGISGTYNVAGPAAPMTLAELFAGIVAAVGSTPQLVWADERFLLDADVEPWSDLPVWTGDDDLLARVDIGAALATGLRFTSLARTVEDVLAYERVHPVEPKALSAEREAELIARLRAHAQT